MPVAQAALVSNGASTLRGTEANAAWYSDDVLKLGQGLNREERVTLAMAILAQAGYTWESDQKPTWDPGGGGRSSKGVA